MQFTDDNIFNPQIIGEHFIFLYIIWLLQLPTNRKAHKSTKNW
jgi:hypothetical protein